MLKFSYKVGKKWFFTCGIMDMKTTSVAAKKNYLLMHPLA